MNNDLSKFSEIMIRTAQASIPNFDEASARCTALEAYGGVLAQSIVLLLALKRLKALGDQIDPGLDQLTTALGMLLQGGNSKPKLALTLQACAFDQRQHVNWLASQNAAQSVTAHVPVANVAQQQQLNATTPACTSNVTSIFKNKRKMAPATAQPEPPLAG